MIYPRTLTNKVLESLKKTAAVVILGARQVGKTTLAKTIAQTQSSVYLDLERPRDYNALSDPEMFFSIHQNKLVILDEIQRYPDLFKILRGIIDQRRFQGTKHGHFLLLGSASKDLLGQSSESLAGRVSYLELSGFSLTEVMVKEKNRSSLSQLWLRGGFPESFLAKTDQDSRRWREDFILTYIERDFSQFGIKMPSTTMMRFFTMIAHLQGSTWNFSKLSGSLNVKNTTIRRYLDLIEDMMLVRSLKPCSGNLKKRLIKTPRIYIRDSGLLHAALEITDTSALINHPVYGKSWEGFVIEQILIELKHSIHPFFYRSVAGAEIDLVLEIQHDHYWAVEIKATSTPQLSKGFFIACDDLKVKEKFVIYNGDYSYYLHKNVLVLPVEDFIAKINNLQL